MTSSFIQFWAIVELAVMRIWYARGRYGAVACGILVAVIIVCAIVLYAEGINTVILREQLASAHQDANFDLLIKGDRFQIDAARYQQMEQVINNGLQTHIGLPTTHIVRHGWVKPLRLLPPPAGQSALTSRVQFYSELERWVTVTAGRLPQPSDDPQEPIEVVATSELATELGLSLNDSITLAEISGAPQPMQVSATLVGLIKPKLAEEVPQPLYAPRFLNEALTTSPVSFFNGLALNIVPNDTEVTWAINYDEQALTFARTTAVINGLDAFRFGLTEQLENTQVLTNLDATLRTYRGNVFQLRGLLFVLGAPIVGIALYYVMQTSALIIQDQRAEIAVLKSRGSPDIQLILLLFIQAVLIITPIVLFAPYLAVYVAQIMGRTTSFLTFDNNQILPLEVQSTLYGYAIVVGLVSLVTLIQPARKAVQQTLIQYRRLTARGETRSLIYDYYGDVICIFVGIVGYVVLAQSGSIISQNEQGNLTLNPLLILTPIISVAGLSFFSLRFLPWLLKKLTQGLSQTNSNTPLFALQQVSRAPSRYQGLILLLTYTLSLGLFTATLASTFDNNDADQRYFTAGANLRVREFDSETGQWFIRSLDTYQQQPEITNISPVRRVRLVGRRAEIRATGILLAIDPATFAQVAWWRSDFQPDLNTIRSQLRGTDNAVLADVDFLRQHRLQIGDEFEMDVGGERANFTLVGTIGLFPTLYPDEGSHLITRLDYLTTQFQVPPTEVWLDTNVDDQQQIKESLTQLANGLIQFHDGITPSTNPGNTTRVDPLQTGIFGTLSLGFAAATGLSLLSLLIYAYLGLRQRSGQFGLLQAMGFSARQILAVITIEQLILVGVAILLGTLLGGITGWLFTRFLQLSIIAQGATPPFLIVIPWPLIGRLYITLLVIAGLALGLSGYFLQRMQIHASLRVQLD
ncbi:MAG: ABC transporter permease [Chloroflexota bacterium]